MDAGNNRRLLEDIFAGLAIGDGSKLFRAMAPDFRWRIAGSSAWSCSWDGKDAVLTRLIPALRERMPAGIRTVAHRITAEGDRVVVEARGRNVTRDGRRYENEYCFVYRLADGQLRELTEYGDTELMLTALGAPPP